MEFAERIRTPGTIFVMICSVIIYIVQFYFESEAVTKFVDPIISIVSGITLLVLSYPYSKYSIQNNNKTNNNKNFNFKWVKKIGK